MPKDVLKTFKSTLVNAKDDLQVVNGCNRCPHNNDNASLGTDNNLTNRQNLQTQTDLKNSAKVLMRYWSCNFTSQTLHRKSLHAGNGYEKTIRIHEKSKNYS